MTMYKFATPECRSLLPQVLIDHLWKLAGAETAEHQSFVLSPKYTGVGEVQDILHRRGRFSSWSRVFGYQPVEAVVEVNITDFGAIMSLKEAPPPRPHAAEKEEGMVCSA